MKRVLILSVIIVLLIGGCGKSEAVKKTEDAIAAIGTITLESEGAIIDAEKLYNILTDKEKEQVSNRLVLVDARDEYEKLVTETAAAAKQSEEQLEASMCLALLNAIKEKQSYSTKPVPWKSSINPNKTRYEVSISEMQEENYRFCGTCYLYDDYGNLTSRFSDGSGSYKVSFEIILAPDGSAISVSLK